MEPLSSTNTTLGVAGIAQSTFLLNLENVDDEVKMWFFEKNITIFYFPLTL